MKKPNASIPAPGAPLAAPPDLLVGVYALATLGPPTPVIVLHLFDCQVKISQKLVEVTGHGDEWDQWVPLRQGWTATARGYLTRSGAATVTYVGQSAKKSASGPELTFALYSDWGTTPIFAGTCFMEDCTISRPNAMVEQEITLRGSTTPTTGPA